MKTFLRVAGLVAGIALATAASAAGPGGSGSQPDQTFGPRGALVYRIVERWADHVEEAYSTNLRAWTREMAPVFAKAPLSALEKAASARTFTAMNSALLGQTLTRSSDVDIAALGAVDSDLVYVPVTPCRLFDTRVAGGPIAANTVRGFDVTAVSSYAFQGGANTDCGGVGAAGSFAAAAVNLTVVSPSSVGYITAFPFGGTQPLAATVNYVAGDIRGNFAVVRLDQGAAANEMSVYSVANTHLVGDIVGYFTQAKQSSAALDCVTTATNVVSVGVGGTSNLNAPACAAGYTETGTNCESGSWQMPMVYIRDGTCSAQNNGSAAADLRASRRCCRVPGT